MAIVTIGTEKKEYEIGTTFFAIAQEYQPLIEDDILLVSVGGRLRELNKQVKDDCTVEFITARDKAGFQTYQRSALFVMLKAFFDVVGKENTSNLTVCFTIGKGLYIEPEGTFVLTQEQLDRVKQEMYRLVQAEIPIEKRSENTEDAIELFHRHQMYDKEKLFYYRRASRVNIYNIENFEDYFFGYMVPHTGYVKFFDLKLYDEGFVLLLPDKDNPKEMSPFIPRRKLFEVQKESENWGKRLGVFNVGTLNGTIAQGRINELILMQEAFQEKEIGDIAEQISTSENTKFVMIAGPSSSGKTTFSRRLSIQLRALGLMPHPISVDDYFVNREFSPKDASGNYDFEALECLDIKKFNEDMTDLLEGKTVELPHFNFINGKREYKGDYLTLGKEDILVIEGIHCLNDKLSYSLPEDSRFRIYISALTQLNIDEHNRIPTTDGRLLRRMVRDARTRGASAQDTIRMWDSVRNGEEHNIFPFQEKADVMFNSALLYELAVLKQYAEPLLFSIPRESKEYLEAKRLLKFFDYFLGVSSEQIPNNSIIREFIGGSCFRI
ncbi:MAG: nucleoside kinase [Clostridium sp.]